MDQSKFRILRSTRRIGVALAFAFAALTAVAQFPLSIAVTGDTALSGITNVEPLCSFPWGSSGILVVNRAVDGPRCVELNDTGQLITDVLITDSALETRAAIEDSGIIVVGRRFGAGNYNAVLARLDAGLASYDWLHQSVNSSSTSFHSVRKMANGDLLAIGRLDYTSNELSPYVRRFTSTGMPIWTYSPPAWQVTYCNDALELPSGNLLLTGMNGPPLAIAIKVYCLSLNAAGGYLTSSDLGSGGFQYGSKVIASPDGQAVIWGGQDSPVNLFVAKVDGACTSQWTHYHAGLRFGDALYDPVQDNYVVTGQKNGAGLLVARFDLGGDTLWTKTYGDPSAIGKHIRSDGFSGYLITGRQGSGLSAIPFLLRIDENGLVTDVTDHTISAGPRLTVIPNPASDQAILVLAEPLHAPGRMDLFDATGTLIRSDMVDRANDIPIPFDGLAPGQYFITIKVADGTALRTRWILQ